MFIVTEYAALKRQEKMYLKMPSAEVVCYGTDNCLTLRTN